MITRMAIAARVLDLPQSWRGATYEIAQLVDAAREHFDEVIPIPLRHVWFLFQRGQDATAFVGPDELPRTDVLVVRGTGEHLDRAQILSMVLEQRGVVALDPPARYRLGGVSKLLSTMDRHARGVGSSTAVVFSSSALAAAAEFVGARFDHDRFIVKPLAGAHGRGVASIGTDELPSLASVPTEPLLLQPREQISAEFRAVMLDGTCVALVRKVAEPSAPANAARGAHFEPVDARTSERVLRFLSAARVPYGLVGIDAALVGDDYRIIEENFAPGWRAVDRALNIRVAVDVVHSLAQRSLGGTAPWA